MNKKQFSEHIGNIDDRLVEQAGELADYGKRRRRNRRRYLAGAAAVLALMAGSFGAGARAFARETVVEVPIKQETAVLEEINLTLILPGSWKGKYSVVKKGNHYIFRHTEISEALGDGEDAYSGGVLFTIVCYEEAMTPEQFVEKGYDFVPYRYLFSTSDRTYVLCAATDVQWDPEDPSQEEEYLSMAEELGQIKFVADNVLE